MKFFLGAIFSFICCSGWSQSWSDYYEKTLHANQPRSTLIEAIQRFEQEEREPGLALDLGCGTGRDTLYLLEKKWKVIALDREEEALCILNSRINPENLSFISFDQSEFLEALFPEQVDLINASYSIPFCEPEWFPLLWEKIERHLSLSGRFSGQFFGDRDTWASNSRLTHHARQEILDLLLTHFEIEYFEEEEADYPAASGEMKHWHTFHVTAKKVR